MHRRSMITGLAALVPAIATRRLFAQETGAGSCRLITQDVTGPYHVDQQYMRSDVREGEKGVPLTLDFRVVNAMGCAPLAGALVTIWSANRDGLYSSVENLMLNKNLEPTGEMIDMSSKSFLRGVQKTDEQGRVRFTTVFPGWYYPRVPHLHVRVSPPDFGEVATTQLYFANHVCDAVFATEHYAHRGPHPIRTEPGRDDPLFASEAGDLWLKLRKAGDGYAASHELGAVFYGGMFGELTDTYRQS